MKMLRRTLSALIPLVLISSLFALRPGAVTEVSAQPIGKPGIGLPGPGGDEMKPNDETYTFNVDENLSKIVQSLLNLIRPGLDPDEWRNVIEAIQGILDDPADRMVEIPDGRRKGSLKKVSGRLIANQLLQTMPPAGRAFYQREVGPNADAILKRGLTDADFRAIVEVALRYFYTKSGLIAAELVARRDLDRGRYSAAADLYNRIIDRPYDDAGSPLKTENLFYGSLAHKRLAIEAAAQGDTTRATIYETRAKTLFDRMKTAVGDRGLKLAGKNATLPQLEGEFGRSVKFSRAMAQLEFFTPRGSADNNGFGSGGRPFLAQEWAYPMMDLDQIHLENDNKQTSDNLKQMFTWLREQYKSSQDQAKNGVQTPHLPPFHPVASSGKVLFRTYEGIVCVATRAEKKFGVDIKPGDILWKCELNHGSIGMLLRGGADTSIRDLIGGFRQSYTNISPMMPFENELTGTLTHDGSMVYAIDDITIPNPNVAFVNPGMPNQPRLRPEIAKPTRYSVLVAVDIETGSRRWIKPKLTEVSNSPEPGNKPFAPADLLVDSHYLSAPLPYNGLPSIHALDQSQWRAE